MSDRRSHPSPTSNVDAGQTTVGTGPLGRGQVSPHRTWKPLAIARGHLLATGGSTPRRVKRAKGDVLRDDARQLAVRVAALVEGTTTSLPISRATSAPPPKFKASAAASSSSSKRPTNPSSSTRLATTPKDRGGFHATQSHGRCCRWFAPHCSARYPSPVWEVDCKQDAHNALSQSVAERRIRLPVP